MDEFDAVDIVYDAVAAAGTDIVIYKDASEAGVTNEHIVINHLQLNSCYCISYYCIICIVK